MREMVERVARALAFSESGNADFYESLDVLTKAAFQRDARAAIEAMQPRPPTAVHWLGDCDSASETRHAVDVRGCVLYFQMQSECADFMEWLGTLRSCGGDPGQAADRHDISCSQAIK